MTQDVTVPKIDAAGGEITVAAWLKGAGDSVAAGEVIAEVLTEKVNIEISSPVTGILDAILANEGDVVAEGDAIGRVVTER